MITISEFKIICQDYHQALKTIHSNRSNGALLSDAGHGREVKH